VRRFIVSVLVATAAGAALAAPAAAAPPTRTEGDIVRTDRDDAACGSYGVAWNVDLHFVQYDFRDDQGRLSKRVQHVTEDNTVVNTATGFTLRDYPVDFVQTTFFDPATGARKYVFIVGTSVNVRRGRERIVDRGPILIDAPTGRIIWSAGPHPVREAIEGNRPITEALPVFCDILR